MKKEKRKVPIKNYFILGIIAFLTIFLTLYINEWIKTYKDGNELLPLDGEVQQVNINELEVTLSETNQVILYVGYEGLNSLDKAILKRLKKDEVNDYFYYLNVTDYSEKKYLGELKNNFSSIRNDINKAPMFIYIKNGEALRVVDSKNDIVNINDLNMLIDNYILN